MKLFKQGFAQLLSWNSGYTNLLFGEGANLEGDLESRALLLVQERHLFFLSLHAFLGLSFGGKDVLVRIVSFVFSYFEALTGTVRFE